MRRKRIYKRTKKGIYRRRKYYGRSRSTAKKALAIARRANSKISSTQRKLQYRSFAKFDHTIDGGAPTLSWPYVAVNLMLPEAWTPCFEAYNAPKVNSDTQIYHRKMTMEMQLLTNNEDDIIDFTIFLVSMKGDGLRFIDNNTGNLRTLVNGSEYSFGNQSTTAPSDTGQVFLNPAIFKIHKVWRTYTGNELVQPTNFLARQKYRKRWTLKTGFKLDSRDANKSWRDERVFSSWKHKYLIIFNNNSTADFNTCPRFTVHILHMLTDTST